MTDEGSARGGAPIPVSDELWLGSFNADRLAYRSVR
jgi:hypothetical protein